MKPEIIINNNHIIVKGHYDNPTLCAKLDLLCKLYGKIIHKGLAIITNFEFLDKLKFIDTELNFACDDGGCAGGCYTDC